MKNIVTIILITLLAVCGCTSITFASGNDDTPIRDEDRTYSAYNRELDRALDWINEAPDSELDKILALYEYVCLNYSYDYDNSGRDPIIATKKGVCGNYAYLVGYLADGIGIKQRLIPGGPTEQSLYDDYHAWNAVNIDGEWYFLDATWDGNTDTVGHCTFGNFLKNKFNDTHRADFESDLYTEYLEKSTSTRFDDFWLYQESGMEALANNCVPVPYDGFWYYVNQDYQIVKRSTADEDADVTIVRDAGEDGIYIGKHLAIKDGKLYFMGNTSGSNGNTCHEIYQIDLESDTDPVKVFTADSAFAWFGLKNNVFYYNVSGDNNIPISIPNGYVPPSDISITQSEVWYGDFIESIHFSAEVGPENATNKSVDWVFPESSGAIDKDGNWRAVQGSSNPRYDNVYAFTDDGAVYAKVNINVPVAEGIGQIRNITIAHETDGSNILCWTPAKNATKYAVFRKHDYPYQGGGLITQDFSYEWLGETTDNMFELDEDIYRKDYVYGVTPVNTTGMGAFQSTNPKVSDYGPLSEHDKILDYPRNCNAEQVCKETFQITWDEVKDAESYVCTYVEEEEYHSSEQYDFQEVTDNEIILSGLKENSDYLIFISATRKGTTAGNYGSSLLRIHVGEMSCKNHLMRTDSTSATCVDPGNEEYYTCEICGKYYSDSEGNNIIEKDSWIIPKLGHVPGEMTIEDGRDPSCEFDGYYYEVVKCTRCGRNLSHESKSIPALGHIMKHVDEIPPTCMGGGKKEHWECTRCGNVYADEEATTAISLHIPPTGHSKKHVERKEPTCTENGNIEHWYCENCHLMFRTEESSVGYNLSDAVIPATGHTQETIPAVAATCTDTGLTKGVKCSVCGEILTEQQETPALGHNYQNVEESAEAASCTKDGKKADKRCSRCGDIIEGDVIPATGHTQETIPAVAATCKDTGLTEGVKCSVCGMVLIEPQVVPTINHNWDKGKMTVEPECENAGVMTYTCQACGSTRNEAIDAKGHVPLEAAIENEIPSSCTAEGSYDTVVRCSVCDAILSSETTSIPKKAHSLTATEAVEPTYDECGNSAYYTCNECGQYFSDEDGLNVIEKDSWILPKKEIASGATITIDGAVLTVLSTISNTVAYTKAPNEARVTIPSSIKIAGKTFVVTQVKPYAFKGLKTKTVTIGKNVKKLSKYAFKSSVVKTMIVKTKKLTKSSVKGSLKGSKVTTIKVKVGTKTINKKYVKKYKKIFTKKNAGKKVSVR